jgi:outer membrane protein TolC
MSNRIQTFRPATVLIFGLITACAPVGPEFVRPQSASNESWSDYVREEFQFVTQDEVEWWDTFNDPVLSQLVAAARRNNNNVRLAGLRVLEARAALGIALGNRYPQAQFLAGDATRIDLSESNANTAGGGDLSYWQYNLGANASWEIDFWGRFRPGSQCVFGHSHHGGAVTHCPGEPGTPGTQLRHRGGALPFRRKQ